MRRIEPRPTRVGAGPSTKDPEQLEELDARRERHERLIHGKPERSFASILAEHRGPARPESGEAEVSEAEAAALSPEPEPSRGAIEPHLGLAPQQDRRLAATRGHRSAKVIVKG